MRNSRRKSIRNAIKKLTLQKNDVLVTKLPKELIPYLVEYLKERFSDKDIMLINLVNDDDIEKLNLGQLIDVRMRCDNLINSRLTEDGKLKTLESALDFKKPFKRGDIVVLDNKQIAIFTGRSDGIKADLYFENGNCWLKDVSNISHAEVKSDFAKKLKLQFYGIKDFRRNFIDFLK